MYRGLTRSPTPIPSASTTLYRAPRPIRLSAAAPAQQARTACRPSIFAPTLPVARLEPPGRATPATNTCPWQLLLRAAFLAATTTRSVHPVSTPVFAAKTGACSRRRQRSEEHTSELQSQSNLVCRLLPEK